MSPIDELWGASADGTQVVRLSGAFQPLGQVFGWAWSPDREWLAFVADREYDGVTAIYTVRTTGPGVPVRVSALLLSAASELFWSPDSDHFAVVADEGGGTALFAAAPDDPLAWAQLGQIQGNTYGVVKVAWAPDGSRVAYLADQDTDSVFELYTSVPDGSDNQKVSGTMTAGGSINHTRGLAWSADSQRIAYIATQETNTVPELFSSTPTSAAGNVKVSGPISSSADWPDSFAWSPVAGGRLAYLAGISPLKLMTSPPASAVGNLQISGAAPPASDWKWAPDGSLIAYRAGTALMTTLPTAANETQVQGPLVAGGSVIAFAWSPDGDRLAFVADKETDEHRELFVTSATGTGTVKVSLDLGIGDAQNPIRSPNGDWITYVADALSPVRQLFATRPTGPQDVVQLSSVIGVSDYFGGAWTADGSRFVYNGEQSVDGQVELFSADPASGAVLKLSGPSVPGQSGVFQFTAR